MYNVLILKSGADTAVDDWQMIYDLDTAPATQLADQWLALPSATRVTSESGRLLLAAARERTQWERTA